MTKSSNSDSENYRKTAQKALEDFKQEGKVRQDVIEKKDFAKEKKKKNLNLSLYVILVICTIIITFQMLKFYSAPTYISKPGRAGSFDTDASTDQCINNLWKIVKKLQLKDTQLDMFSCPKTGKPYKITQKNGDFTAQCPNPKIHGFSSIKVKKDNVIPEIVK